MAPSTKLSAMIFLFVSLMASAPISQAQLGGLGGLLGGLLGLIHISGNVSCSVGGNSGSIVNGVATPAFPNALVQLQCGGNVVASARTNSNGAFSILLNLVQNLLSTLLSSCNVVVKTPLSSCNANLTSSGELVSDGLQLFDKITGLVNIFNLIPGDFQLLSNNY